MEGTLLSSAEDAAQRFKARRGGQSVIRSQFNGIDTSVRVELSRLDYDATLAPIIDIRIEQLLSECNIYSPDFTCKIPCPVIT